MLIKLLSFIKVFVLSRRKEKFLYIPNMIGERFNMDDVFFRDLTVCVLDTFEGQVNWINRFSSGDVSVQVPFYYSLTGDERFLLDSFQDDIVSENRFVELNTDMIPRGHITMTGFNIKSDEFANPNVWLRMVVENEVEIRRVLAKVRAVPITVNYDLTILLSSELDTFKCSQAIMDTMWIYKFMYFEHNFMNIDAVILMPDTNQIELSREKNLTSDNNITLKVSFEVHTYYPAFRKDRVSMTGYPSSYGSGMSDLNGFSLAGGVSDFFEQGGSNKGVNNPYNYIGGTPSVGPNQQISPPDYDSYMVAPKRTRWFNNILKAREKSATPTPNPNAGPPSSANDGSSGDPTNANNI